MILDLLIRSIKNPNSCNYMLSEKERVVQLLIKLKRAIPEEAVEKIKKERYKKGAYLLRSGDIATKIWFFESGIAHAFYQKGNVKITEYFTFPNEIFGVYSSLVRRSPSVFSIQLLTDAVIWSIEWQDYQRIRELVPLTNEVERLLVACWNQSCIERSINRFFTVEEQYLFLLKRQPKLIEQIPSVYIANYIGSSPETISRVRAKIKAGVDIPDVSPFEYIFTKRNKKAK